MTGSKRIGRRCEFGHWPHADVWRGRRNDCAIMISRPLDCRCENRNFGPSKLWLNWELIG
jgi:hypothetical protein